MAHVTKDVDLLSRSCSTRVTLTRRNSPSLILAIEYYKTKKLGIFKNFKQLKVYDIYEKLHDISTKDLNGIFNIFLK